MKLLKLLLQTLLCAGAICGAGYAHASQPVVQSQFHVTGALVSSTCSVAIEHQSSESGLIDFGELDLSREQVGRKKYFEIKLYEGRSMEPGCTALLASTVPVQLKFGERAVGQLDANGVVTKGAGDGIRVQVSSIDANEVSSLEPITSENSSLIYSKSFAAKGVFRFVAEPVDLGSATTGSYYGSLSVLVAYQ